MERLTISGKNYMPTDRVMNHPKIKEDVKTIARLNHALQKYEDAVERGQLVMLPCKVGDTVYYLKGHIIEQAKVKGIYLNDKNDYLVCFYGWDVSFYIFKKYYFLTYEEAEDALFQQSANQWQK